MVIAKLMCPGLSLDYIYKNRSRNQKDVKGGDAQMRLLEHKVYSRKSSAMGACNSITTAALYRHQLFDRQITAIGFARTQTQQLDRRCIPELVIFWWLNGAYGCPQKEAFEFRVPSALRRRSRLLFALQGHQPSTVDCFLLVVALVVDSRLVVVWVSGSARLRLDYLLLETRVLLVTVAFEVILWCCCWCFMVVLLWCGVVAILYGPVMAVVMAVMLLSRGCGGARDSGDDGVFVTDLESITELNGGEEEEEEEGECGFCLFMKGGGCKDAFIEWEKCVEEGEKNKEDIVEKCFQATAALKKCMEAHSDYYAPILQAEKVAEDEAVKELEKEKERLNSQGGSEKSGSEEKEETVDGSQQKKES
ncbi:unnamed protein product [Fraxinus pennsylvanica]|uniref:GCK domain-containing protein n=1 Tax=Fraxinus pennsylvanica TaxID=56036 RepID=A0AAD2ABN6_9LAMI|nr:unnamed protein product [Fraxinus pennsylvanica]